MNGGGARVGVLVVAYNAQDTLSFARRSFERLLADCSLEIARRAVVSSPIEVLNRSGGSPVGRIAGVIAAGDRFATRIWPTLFGYQFLYEFQPNLNRRQVRTPEGE